MKYRNLLFVGRQHQPSDAFLIKLHVILNSFQDPQLQIPKQVRNGTLIANCCWEIKLWLTLFSDLLSARSSVD